MKVKESDTIAEEEIEGEAPESVLNIFIPRVQRAVLTMRVIGTLPLVFSEFWKDPWSEDKNPKSSLSPEQEAMATLYVTSDGMICFPSSGIKGAMVHAMSYIRGMKKVSAAPLFHVYGAVCRDGGGNDKTRDVRIYGKPEMRRDVGALATGPKRPIYRAQIVEWAAEFQIWYTVGFIEPAQVVNLLSLGGTTSGIGDMRTAAKKNRNVRGGEWRVVDCDEDQKTYDRIVSETESLRVVGPRAQRKVVFK